eukprot:Rhum_TRINITY_DN10917_c0_g1::Rhum_TRINITY_DN10917_c0_g1_i1::g.41235::m.41235/K01934/MTHFS; 5-formyltetrahydrofolate cyclo-ligase
MDEGKNALRKEVKAMLRKMSPEAVQRESEAVWERLMGLSEMKACKGVSVYLHMKNEVMTCGLLTLLFARGKRVYVPCITGPKYSNMVMVEVRSAAEVQAWPLNKWGIPELPLEEALARPDVSCTGEIDLVVTPGVAFTPDCDRLGHGRGYYDSYLARATAANSLRGTQPPHAVGLSLSPQIVPTLPTGEFDKKLTAVVTHDTVHRDLTQKASEA